MRISLAIVSLLLVVACGSPVGFAQAPVLPPNSVVNGASFRVATDPNGAIGPGSLVSIFGSNLASSTLTFLSVPISTTLGDTSVVFSVGSQTFAAPLFFVSPGVVNAQVPFELPVGPGVTVQVVRGSAGSSQSQPQGVAAVSPGIFTLNQQGSGQGAILIANSDIFAAPVGSIPGKNARPAAPGEFISIFCTGLGPLQTPVKTGDFPPSPPPQTMSLPSVNFGSPPIAAIPTYSGVAPCCVSLYQVNVQVPQGMAASSAVAVQIIINNVPSNVATIAVGSP